MPEASATEAPTTVEDVDEIITCHTCGLSSALSTAFTPRRVKGRKVHECPACTTKLQQQGARNGLLVLSSWLLIGAGLAALDIGFGWLVVNFFFVQLFMMIMIGPHELGHLLGARSAGLRVPAVSVGAGRRLALFHFLGARWDWRLLPLGGLALISDRGLPGFRWRVWWATLMGPVVNAAAVGILWALGVRLFGDFGTATQGLTLALDFAWANFIIVVVNLIPMSHRNTYGYRQGTDGLELLTIPFMSNQKMEERRAGSNAMESQIEMLENRPEKALALAREGLARIPGDFHLTNAVGIAELALGDFTSARQTFASLADKADQPELKAVMNGNQAWAAALSGEEFLGEADRLSQEAMATMPWMGSLQSTRGFVLAANGRPQEGLELMQKALADAQEDRERVPTMLSMAYAYTLLEKAADAEALLRAVKATGEHSAELDALWAKIDDARGQLAEAKESASQ